MDEDTFYASDERSSIDRIEQDFAASILRSLQRREMSTILRAADLVGALVFVIALIVFFKLAWPA